MNINNLYPYLLILGGVGLSIASKKIDLKGGIVGGLITIMLFASISYLGIALISLFFIVGTLASLHKLRVKQQWGISEGKSGKRGWRNVLANSGVAGIVAVLDVWVPAFILNDSMLIAACFATALSDTLSSELGNVFGKRYYNILTWETGQRGKDGFISLEGTTWGVIGSILIAGTYAAFDGINKYFWIIATAGFIGNLVDSILGATAQKSGMLSNHGVNFVSTAFATLFVALVIFL